MKIVFDNIIYSLQNAGGISVYWSELSKRMLGCAIDFYGRENDNIFYKQQNINQLHESSLPLKILRYLDFRKKLPKKTVFHSSYYRIANQKDVVNIVTVYDFTYEKYRSGLARFIHSWQKRRAIYKSDGIICISKSTKQDLMRYYPNVKEDKIKVIYLGADESFKALEDPIEALRENFSELADREYILYVGDRSSYKNFDIAVMSLKNLANKTLVIVGGGELSFREKEQLKEIKFEHYLNLASNSLNILYNNAFCFLYPSSYEGFGIPVLEAMSAGCPVVSSNISSIPEVAGEAALLVDKIEVDEFVEAMVKLEEKSFRDDAIIKGLQQSIKFSWDKCFEETLDFYKKVVNKRLS